MGASHGDNLGAVRPNVELTGPARWDAPPASSMIDKGGVRAAWPAVLGPVLSAKLGAAQRRRRGGRARGGN